MQLEDYFDFLAPDDIRIKGHRIGIETVLEEHLRSGRLPEEIVASYPSLSLEEVYATLLYYHRNREAIDRYLADRRECGRAVRDQQRRNPSAAVEHLREMMSVRSAGSQPS